MRPHLDAPVFSNVIDGAFCPHFAGLHDTLCTHIVFILWAERNKLVMIQFTARCRKDTPLGSSVPTDLLGQFPGVFATFRKVIIVAGDARYPLEHDSGRPEIIGVARGRIRQKHATIGVAVFIHVVVVAEILDPAQGDFYLTLIENIILAIIAKLVCIFLHSKHGFPRIP